MLTLLISALLLAPMQSVSDLDHLARDLLWPADATSLERAEQRLDQDASLVGVDRFAMLDLEEILRRGRPDLPEPPGQEQGRYPVRQIEVDAGTGQPIPVLVQLPSDYSTARAWPMLLAMHGGPPGDADGAWRGAASMLRVWTDPAERAGWIVAAPVMLSTVAAGAYTPERLPYGIFEPEQAQAVLDAMAARFRINPDRVVPTGISLGSNFSIAYAAARPDRYAAIVPVSTEGDSRVSLLANLAAVPTYVLEGSQDGNIRGIFGPRAMQQILSGLGAECVYREFSDRSHEGFGEHYDDVLSWLDGHPRQLDRPDVLRVPHDGIVPLARSVFWVTSDTRQGLIRARVVDRQRIELQVRWARELTLDLNDQLVDLDRPLTILVNGEQVFRERVRRSLATALREARRRHDAGRVVAARLTLEVPTSASSLAAGRALWEQLKPDRAPGTLSYWEMYASRSLVERWPGLGVSAEEQGGGAEGAGGGEGGVGPGGVGAGGGAGSAAAAGTGEAGGSASTGESLNGEQVALRVTHMEADSPLALAGVRVGDQLLEIWGEPFFAGQGGVEHMADLLRRELRETPRTGELLLWRDGKELRLPLSLALGPYRDAVAPGSPGAADRDPDSGGR